MQIYKCPQCGEFIDIKEKRYVYRDRSHHHDCLLERLKKQKRPKLTIKEIRQIIKDSVSPSSIELDEQKKAKARKNTVSIPKVSKKQFDAEKEAKETFYNFIGETYGTPVTRARKVQRDISNITKGTSQKLQGETISYSQLYDMFKFYMPEISYIKSVNAKQFDSKVSEFFYDLAIVLSKLEKYNYKFGQMQNNQTETESFRVSDFARNIKGQEIANESSNVDDIDLSSFDEDY